MSPEAPSQPTGQSRADRRRSRRTSPLRSLLEWVAVIGGALIVALVIRTFLFQAFYIPSESMLPTLQESDRVLVNKLSYDLHGVNRGDIVVFNGDGYDDPTTSNDVTAFDRSPASLETLAEYLRDGGGR